MGKAGGGGGRPSGGASPGNNRSGAGGAGRRGAPGPGAPGRGAAARQGGRHKDADRRKRPELSGNRRRDDWYHEDDNHVRSYAGDRRVRSYESDNRGVYRTRPGAVVARLAVVAVALGLVALLAYLLLG